MEIEMKRAQKRVAEDDDESTLATSSKASKTGKGEIASSAGRTATSTRPRGKLTSYFASSSVSSSSSSSTVSSASSSSAPTCEEIALDHERILRVQDETLKSGSFSSLEELLPLDWKVHIGRELSQSYFKDIKETLLKEEKSQKIFPPPHMVFNAFTYCPWHLVRVVILGQDPYHDDRQAHGLCFSVQPGIKVPSSLQNIYKEIASDTGKPVPDSKSGTLTGWSQQGVLLLNTALTVRAHDAASHSKIGWHRFTSAVIQAISDQKENVVFILWGKHAHDRAKMIDSRRHHVIRGVHPSGLSASRGFFGSKPFSECNKYLTEHGLEPIVWQKTGPMPT